MVAGATAESGVPRRSPTQNPSAKALYQWHYEEVVCRHGNAAVADNCCEIIPEGKGTISNEKMIRRSNMIVSVRV